MKNRARRKVGMRFNETFFRPRGIPLNELDIICITDEELETLRLRYLEKMDQDEAAKEMGISQSQYQRDITLALQKLTKALIEGQAININRIETILNSRKKT